MDECIEACDRAIKSCENIKEACDNVAQQKVKNFVQDIKNNDPTAIMVLMGLIILLLVGLIYGLWLNNRELVFLVNKFAQNCVVF